MNMIEANKAPTSAPAEPISPLALSHDPNYAPPNAREVCKHLTSKSDNERRLIWFLHSIGQYEQLAYKFRKWCQGGALEYGHWEPDYGLTDGNLAGLLAFEQKYNAGAIASFYQTNIGHEVWQTLSYCLASRRCGVIEGLPGRGKSAASAAFHKAHQGESWLVTVAPFDTDADFFHRLAESIGLRHVGANSPSEIRRNAESILVHGGKLLILDEAQRLLPAKVAGRRPRRLEWIMDLVERGVCVVMIGTDRLAPRITAVESPDWNGEQFKRRFAGRWITLPDSTAEEDLAALAARYLPRIGKRGQKQAVEYARHLRDVSGLFDLVKDAQEVARHAGREEPDQNDFQSALNVRLLNDGRMDKSFAIPTKRAGASRRQPVCEPTAAQVQSISRAIAPAPQPMNSAALAARSRSDLVAETV